MSHPRRMCQRPSGHTEFSRSPGSMVQAGMQSPLRNAGQPYLSVLGGTFSQTPLVLPVRGHLDSINRLMTGDCFFGRGSRQRSLKRSIFCNTHKVSAVGRDRAIEMFKEDLSASPILLSRLWTLSGLRLVCHCVPSQRCHGDILIEKFMELYPSAFDRSRSTDTPNAATLSYLAALREEPPSDPGSSADEGAPQAGSGWTGIGSSMTVGIGYTARPFCDGQSLASPGRWVPEQRRYPSHPAWSAVSSLFSRFTATYGSPELLMQLDLGKVDSSPFDQKEIAQLKADVIASLHGLGLQIKTSTEDSPDVSVGISLFGNTSRCCS